MASKFTPSTPGIYPLSELAKGSMKSPPPLFGGLILDNSLTMVTAPPYVGKSLLLASMAVSLDSGAPLLGRYPPAEDKRVLVVAQDAPMWDYGQQFAKVVRGMGIDDATIELLDTRLVLCKDVNIMEPSFIVDFESWVDAYDPNVIIFDAFWTIHNLDENSNSQMAAVMHRLKFLRDKYGVAVIFSHHMKKPIAGVGETHVNYTHRGASTIAAAIDFNLVLKRNKQRVMLNIAKGRGGDEGIIAYDIEERDDPRGPAISLVAIDLDNKRLTLMLSLLTTNQQRKQLIVAYKEKFPELTFDRASKAVDNDLQLLQAERKIERKSHGIWGLR